LIGLLFACIAIVLGDVGGGKMRKGWVVVRLRLFEAHESSLKNITCTNPKEDTTLSHPTTFRP